MKLTVKDIAEARGFKNAKQLADASGVHYKSMTRSGPAKRSSLHGRARTALHNVASSTRHAV